MSLTSLILKSERPDAGDDLRRRLRQIAIDEHMSLRRGNENGAQALHTDVVGVAVDPKRLLRDIPFRAMRTWRGSFSSTGVRGGEGDEQCQQCRDSQGARDPFQAARDSGEITNEHVLVEAFPTLGASIVR